MKCLILAWSIGTVTWAAMPTLAVLQTPATDGLNPLSAAWNNVPSASIALQRTPLLYPTDEPAAPEIPAVQVRLMRSTGGVFIRLEWRDKSRDATTFGEYKRAWQGEQLVTQSEATNRFSDGCAVMVPVKADPSGVSPSLQMGDAAHPVLIYFWDASRGAALMEAQGRETTKRTGRTFPSQSAWVDGKWTVTLQLPDLPSGTPLAVAIWNGQQQDRDGRKYFSVWYKTQ
jgi:DMSO reductase family type II enzyme heme b subunit